MTAQTRSTLKGVFEDGDKPQGSDYANLIDSFISIADTTAQTATSDFTAPKLIATTEVSSPQINTTEVSASTGNFHQAAVSGHITIGGYVSASAARIPLLDGPVQVGTSAGDRGYLVLTQQVTLTPSNTVNATAAVLPAGADVIDIRFFMKTAFNTAAADVVLRVGTSANETLFGTISFDTNIVPGLYTITGSAGQVSAATDWVNVTGAARNVMAQVTAVSGAFASAGEGILSVIYVQK